MIRYIVLLLLVAVTACNSKKTNPAGPASTKDTSWTADELDFIDGCVANAAESIGEEKAFILCKCILLQVKNENPSLDSSFLVRLSSDTAKVARLAKNCK